MGFEPSKNLSRADVEAIAKQVAENVYASKGTRFGVAEVPYHVHNGIDSPNIPISNIEQLATSGNITMATDGTRYAIGLNVKSGFSFAPSSIRFNGIVIHQTVGVTDIRALVQGDAFIGSSFYLQPLSSVAVTVGGAPQAVIQSSSYLLVNDSGSGPVTQALSSEGHIVSVTFNSVIVARATIPDFGDFGNDSAPFQQGSLFIDVSLVSGWQIIGNFLIK